MTNDFVTQEKEYSFDLRRDGFIHTSEVQARWRQGIDLEQPRGNKRSITEWRGGVNKDGGIATFRFNPNNERICSPYSGNMVKRGNCRSLEDFENILTVTVNKAGFERGDLEITRVDFAKDCYSLETIKDFHKLCDLMIFAFIVKNDISKKNQYYGFTSISREHKTHKAKMNNGVIEIEKYCKGIQQPTHGALWRLELRFRKDRKRPDKKQPTEVREMLEAIVEELHSLPKFYRAAQRQLNEALLSEYGELQAESSKDRLKINQFLYLNDDRIFSRAQVKDFFRGLGVDPKKAGNIANNYSSRYKPLYISAAELTQFTEYLGKLIETYIKNDTFFEDFSLKTERLNAG